MFAHILKGRWHYLEHDWVVDQQGGAMGYDDAFTRLEGTRRHYESAGVDARYLDTLIR